MSIRALLFDFDGTLADSFGAITLSVNHVRGLYGQEAVPESEVRKYVGRGVQKLMEDLVQGVPVAEAVAKYEAHHPSVMIAETRLLPGVKATLTQLHAQGFKLAVCSNKPVQFTRDLVSGLELNPLFEAVLGPEDVGAPKPNPAMLLEGARRLGTQRDETVYVGDMTIDVKTAQAAGISVWLVPGGADMDEAVAANPTKVLRSFAEILELLALR